jgi:hypothetical protein
MSGFLEPKPVVFGEAARIELKKKVTYGFVANRVVLPGEVANRRVNNLKMEIDNNYLIFKIIMISYFNGKNILINFY